MVNSGMYYSVHVQYLLANGSSVKEQSNEELFFGKARNERIAAGKEMRNTIDMVCQKTIASAAGTKNMY